MPHKNYGTPPSAGAFPTFVGAGKASVSTLVAIDILDGLTTDMLASADRAVISTSNGTINYTYGGDAPTATFGHTLKSGRIAVIKGNVNINNLKFIKGGAPNGDITVTLEKV